MTRKLQSSKWKKSPTTKPSQVDKLSDLVGRQIFHRDYTEAIANSERLLSYLPQQTSQRADALAQLGIAHSMLQNFPQSYAAFTEALSVAMRGCLPQPWGNLGICLMMQNR